MNIFLKGGEMYLSKAVSDVYKVKKGPVLVYIVPVIDGKAGRRSFIYEASTGEELPSFYYTDYYDRKWTLGFVALEKAELSVISGGMTEELKAEFAKKTKLKSYANEGFEDGLVEQYELNIVKEDGFIHKTRQEQKQAYEGSLKLIYDIFHSRKQQASDSGKDSLYKALAYLCKKEHISIAPADRISAGCGAGATVSDIARLSHFMARKVMLPEDWYKKDSGPMIVFDNETGKPYACVTKSATKYYLYDPETEEKTILNKEAAMKMAIEAYMIYRPFSDRSMGIKEIIGFLSGSIKIKDIALVLALTLIGSLIGLLIPTLNQMVYDSYIPLGSSSAVIQVCSVILAFTIGNVAFSVVRELAAFRLESRLQYDAQSAAYDRLFNLPESFFRQYDSGDMTQRVMGVSSFMSSILGIVFGTFLSGVFSIVYLFRMLGYSGILSAAAIIMLLLYSIAIIAISLKTIKYNKQSLELGGKVNSLMYQLLNGIEKIRIAGVEDRALYEYLKSYTGQCNINMKAGRLGITITTLSGAVSGLFSLVLYYLMIHGGVNISMGAFIAFTSAFGTFSGAVLQMVQSSLSINQLKPLYKRIKPIFESIPELDESTELPGDIKGDIEISNVSFGYSDTQTVINDLSLHIKEGEYVGIVGPSGCGKSTLLKLLLGFEKPQKGKIFYDRKDIEGLDKRELRKKMGVVLQDGKLIAGSIYENIVIAAPEAGMERVLETVEEVGLKEDVDIMPMGLHTVVSESSGTISGGQQQRILIARAIVGKPKILLFDEATSALDNVTQAMVCDSLDRLDSTRIVIAHRLSTVIRCDRIIVLGNGNIVEEGTYDELMEKRGYFYELASRQIA